MALRMMDYLVYRWLLRTPTSPSSTRSISYSKAKIILSKMAELMKDADYRMGSTRVQNPQDFLNSEPSARRDNKYKTMWTRARQASDRLKVKLNITENDEVELIAGDNIINGKRKVYSTLRSTFRKNRTLSLSYHKLQGKTNSCIAAVMESTHFFD